MACSDASSPNPSPLQGLAKVSSNDTGVTTSPPGPSTPGAIHGYVLGQGTPPDTFTTAPRLANVRVTAYPRIRQTNDTLGVGPAAASVLTDANGVFQMPEIPGGEYVVTFNPQAPDDLAYRGAWTVTTIYSGSGDYPWWIYLPKH